MEITQEKMQAMIDAAVERRLDERRSNRTRISKLLDKYDEEFERFDYTEHWAFHRCDGSLAEGNTEHCHAHKVRTAIMMLMRAHFRVENINKLSAEQDDEVKAFVEGVLRIAKPKEA